MIGYLDVQASRWGFACMIQKNTLLKECKVVRRRN
jgi:hypothetical protein